jgi:hypothetical protein
MKYVFGSAKKNKLLKFFDLHESVYTGSKEFLEFFAVSVLAFVVPIALGHQQLIVGTTVNALLIYGAIRFNAKKIIPLILLPSVSVLLGGFMFGSITNAILYLLPFIWLGNTAIVLGIKHFSLNKKMVYTKSLVFSVIAKVTLIAGGASALIFFGLVPNALLVPMSALQLVTALAGGTIAFFGLKLFR